MSVGRWIELGFAAALLTAVGCSSGDSGSSTPVFACTDGGSALPDGVTLRCGGTGGSTVIVDVVMGGTASGSTTLRGLSFDVTYDPAKVAFVGDAPPASPLFPQPPALIAVTLFDNTQGRVVVGIQQPNGFSDVTVAAGQQHILSLTFNVVAGASFGPTPLAFANTAATGASAAIGFTSGLALSY